MPKHLRHITLALIVICSLGFLQVSAQTTSTSSTEETSRAEIDSALQSIRDYFDEILDVQIGWAALNARHISNVGYGLDNTIGLNSDLRDTIKVLREILESEVFVKSMVQYDHFWTNLVNRKKYSPTEDELENHFGELYSRNLKFDIRFIPAWDTTIADDVDIARKSETGLTYNCKIIVQGKGIFTAEISQNELETVLNQSFGDSTFKKIKKEARPAVNQSLFTGLRWLTKFKYTSFEDPSNIACVEFRAPSSKYNSGFDAYDEKLDGTYTTATIKAKNYKVPWKSIAETNNDVILAVVKKKDQSESVTDTLKFTSGTGVSYSIQQRIGDSIYLVNIPSESIAGEKSLVATYTYSDSTGEEVTVTAGQLNIAAYTTQTMNVVIVPLVDMPSGLSVSVLQDSLNSIYGQAAIKWVVTEDDKLTVDGINTSSIDDGETSLFSNYTDDMNDIIDAYKDKKDDIDKKTEYIFLVGQAASGSGKCGYMPLKTQFGFIFVNSTCSDQLEKTIAHELGHGPFRLFHPFSTSDQNHYYRAQGSTHNLMDYTGNKKDVALNKYQWDYIHDPQSISGLFQDEEEGASVTNQFVSVYDHIEKFRCGLLNQEKTTFNTDYEAEYFSAWDIELGDEKTYDYLGFTGLTVAKIGVEFLPYSTTGTEKNYLLNDVKEYEFEKGYKIFVTASQAPQFEAYLFNESQSVYTTQINNLLGVYLDHTTSKFIKLINNLPECAFKSLSTQNIINSLVKLSSETMNDGGGNEISEEDLAIKLIQSCSNSTELITGLKNTDNLLHDLDYRLDDVEYISSDGNHSDFAVTIYEHLKASSPNNFSTDKVTIDVAENNSIFRIKDPLWLLEKKDKSEILNTGHIQFNLTTTETPIIYDFDDWILIYFEVDVPELGFEAGDIKTIPAYFFHYLIQKEINEDNRKTISATIDLVSMAFAIGELKAGVSAIRQVFAWSDIAASLADIPKTAFEEQIENLPGGDEFIHSFNIVSGLIAIMDIGSSSVEGFTKLNKLAGNEITEITEFYGKNKAELTEASKEIAEGARQISRLSQPDWFRALPEELLSDIGEINSDLGKLFANATVAERQNLVESWKIASDAFTSGSKFITDIPTLDRISKLAADGSAFRNKLGTGWEEALDDILKNASDLKCSTCGNAGRIGRSSMEQYLDDVDYFISNFTVSSGGKGEVFYNWMRGTTNPTSGQLDELHQTIRDFAKRGIKESDVEGLGKQFPIGSKKYDLRRVGDKYTEYKNKDFVSYPLTAGSDDVDQFINGYLKNIKSMDDFEWKAGFDKLKSSWSSEANALTEMKKQWKSVFQGKSDDVFNSIWDNQNLRNSLFDSGLTKAEAKLDFLDMVEETDDVLFKFIKVE